MINSWVGSTGEGGPSDLTRYFILLFAGSAITGPVAKECADLCPRIASEAGSIA